MLAPNIRSITAATTPGNSTITERTITTRMVPTQAPAVAQMQIGKKDKCRLCGLNLAAHFIHDFIHTFLPQE